MGAQLLLQGVFFCRGGFEKDLRSELQRGGWTGAIRPTGTPGVVLAETNARLSKAEGGLCGRLANDLRKLAFARASFVSLQQLNLSGVKDRAGQIADAAAGGLHQLGLEPLFSELWVYGAEGADHDLRRFAKKLTPPILAALKKKGVAKAATATMRLHVFLWDFETVSVGVSAYDGAFPQPLGIPRLKFPAGAPSRSTLKLEEALLVFLGREGMQRYVNEGMTAVDLGAAPGGWTYQLVQRGLRVTAVDNGPMAASLRQHPRLRHLRQDGFRYRPSAPVDWLVCDIVDVPTKVAVLVKRWVEWQAFRFGIFNWKLPQGDRVIMIQKCLQILQGAGGSLRQLRVQHLYHDRDEVTVFVERQC